MGAVLAPLAIVSTVAGIAGGGIQAMGQYNSLEAQSANAAYQAQVAANNAVIAGRNANMDLQAGETAEVNRGLKTRAQVGATLAGQSGSGVDVNSGSFVGSRRAVSEIGALDALTIRSDTAKKVYADQTQQSNFEAQSGLLKNESEQADAAAPLAAAGSLLSSASTVGSSAFKFMQSTG
jgi:hypothetical protein